MDSIRKKSWIIRAAAQKASQVRQEVAAKAKTQSGGHFVNDSVRIHRAEQFQPFSLSGGKKDTFVSLRDAKDRMALAHSQRMLNGKKVLPS